MIIITIITIITTIIILNEIIISVFIEVCIEPTPILAFSGWNIASISLKADCKSPSLRLKQGKHIHLDLLTLNFSETFLEFCALLYKITREGCFQQSPSKDSSRAFVSSKSFSSRNATKLYLLDLETDFDKNKEDITALSSHQMSNCLK